MKTPIALNIDDAAPRVFVYREHASSPFTKDGRPLLDEVPNAFMAEFADVIERRGARGKMSVVPSPGGRGDIVKGLEGFPREELDWWLDTVKARVAPRFALGPEMITHHKALDLASGKFLELNETQWSQTQSFETLTPYITYALNLCRGAGLACSGVTSPWDFGVQVEDAYSAAVGAAFEAVYGVTESWYFCRSLYETPNARPWIAQKGERTVVSIPGTVPDRLWKTMDTTDTSEAYVNAVADEYITADGRSGLILDVLNTGGFPIMTTHWQSLFSNGAWTGLRVFDEVARRVNERLSDRVEWTRFDDIMRMTIHG